MQNLRPALYLAVQQIPQGRVTSYGAIARLAGHPKGARWAGRVLSQLPEDTQLPWHRVVNSQGRISLPGDRGSQQQRRLEAEGIIFRNDKIDLALFGWHLPAP